MTAGLDDEGHFFGSPAIAWFATLRVGWEDTNQRLYEVQLKAKDAWYARQAQALARHPARPVALEHVRLFDSESAASREDQTVVIDGERITAVDPAASTAIPANAEHIDGSRKTLLPGLFDMHSHAYALLSLLNIASGVTAVRDMGIDIEELRHLQEKWDSGAAVGPRVWKAGIIDGRSPYQAPVGLYADTPEEAGPPSIVMPTSDLSRSSSIAHSNRNWCRASSRRLMNAACGSAAIFRMA